MFTSPISLWQDDAPPNSWKDSNANPKMKTIKEGIGERSLTCNISMVKKTC